MKTHIPTRDVAAIGLFAEARQMRAETTACLARDLLAERERVAELEGFAQNCGRALVEHRAEAPWVAKLYEQYVTTGKEKP